MEAPATDRPRTPARRRGARAPRRAGLAFLLAAAASLPEATLANAAPQGGRPDQVYVASRRRSGPNKVTGTIVENGLQDLRIEREGKETRYDSLQVERIVWGTVSVPFREGQTYFQRGDFENAAAKLQLAASDDPREVVRAAARVQAGEALLRLSDRDPASLAQAKQELERFLSEYPSNREVPEARRMLARCTWLAGDAAAAGSLYRALFEEAAGAAPTPGYEPMLCLEAGLHAGRALTAAGETLAAREVYGMLDQRARELIASEPEDSPRLSELRRLAAEAELGEGFVLLASGQYSQAQTFFQARLGRDDQGAGSVRFGSLFGLGEALKAQGELRQAMLQYSRLVALAHADRDRIAQALVRLAQCTLELGDPEGPADAKRWLEAALAAGATPSTVEARKLLETL